MKRMMAVALAVLGVTACSGPDTSEDHLSQTTKAKLETAEVKPGSGTEARRGRRVSVHYTGWLYHPTKERQRGRRFDSSRDQNQPFDFTLGAGEVIPGWDEGVLGMKAGGVRTLVIPASLGYGAAGSPPVIPPNATLVFEVELVAVK